MGRDTGNDRYPTFCEDWIDMSAQPRNLTVGVIGAGRVEPYSVPPWPPPGTT